MDIADVVAAIGRMPTEFRERGDISMMQLRKESGYSANPAAVTEAELARHFRTNPDQIDSWLIHSQDNRGVPAWCLLDPPAAKDRGLWVVGFYPGSRRYSFEAADEACAFYVKRYLEDLGRGISDAS